MNNYRVFIIMNRGKYKGNFRLKFLLKCFPMAEDRKT